MLQLLFAWVGASAFAASLVYFLILYLFRWNTVATGPVLPPVVIDVALFSVFALHHSLFARTRFKAVVTAAVPAALERSIYTWVASILFLLVCWTWQPVPGLLYSIPGPWRWLGFGAQFAGLVIIFFGSRALDVLELAGVRQVLPRRAAHRGTPLQTTGVYGLVRHPVYFGWILFVFGTPDMTMTRFVFALVSTAYLVVAIPWEERSLVRTFGADYERYRARVRSRMLPFVY